MNLRLIITLTLSLLWIEAQAADLPGIPKFIDEMVEQHQFKHDELVQVFKNAKLRSDVIAAISAPATIKPWVKYRASFINSARIDGGVKFWKKHAEALHHAELIYGVPQEIIVAVIGVETLYGQHAGTFRTLDALTTLAFDYPRRAAFFRKELAQYLLLAREQQFNILAVKASYAGALGIAQFMPSSYRKHAVDFNANGKVDIMKETDDAIGSVANYLKQYGWQAGKPVAQLAKLGNEAFPSVTEKSRTLSEWANSSIRPSKNPPAGDTPAWLLDFTVKSGKEYWLTYQNFRVITKYNNSNFYAMSVFQLAESLRKAHDKKSK